MNQDTVMLLVRERLNVAEIGEASGLCHEDAYREFMRAMTVIDREDRREHKIQRDRDYRRRKRVLKFQQSAFR